MVDTQPSAEPPANGGASENLGPNVGSKRQRRPSVRLGEIGQPSSKHPPLAKPHSKSPLDFIHFSNPKPKRKSTPRINRSRSNWPSRAPDNNGAQPHRSKSSDYDPDACGSPSPNPSAEKAPDDNEKDWIFEGKFGRARVSEGVNCGEFESDEPSDMDGRDLQYESSVERGRRWRSDEGGGGGGCGVRMWLGGLGLGRYAPAFEIHEVDEEVLPMLTLEDLKEMGIRAVGSRRKMYCSIQKIRKGLSWF